jgi:regulator of sigma E protease
VGQLTPGFPAEDAGLQVGDVITHIDGQPVSHWLELSQIIHNRPEERLELTIERQGSILSLPITPQLQEESGIGLIGIQPPQPMALRRYGLLEAVRYGFQEANGLLGLTMEFLGRVVSGRASSKSIGGPIAIAQIAGNAAATGAANLMWVMAFISLQLGILNLLPIPILDGGLILFLLIEAIRRRPISLKKREIAQQIGLAMIIMLMIFAFYNDIMRLVVG